MSSGDKPQTSKSGAQILRYVRPTNTDGSSQLDEKTAEKIETHIASNIGEFENVFHEIIPGSVHVDVCIVPPSDNRNFYTLVTMGMSAKPMNVPEGAEECRFAELLLMLPASWDLSEEGLKNPDNYWPIKFLKFLARFPHEYNTWLGSGHTIPNGDPPRQFADNVGFTTILVLPSIAFGDDFLTLKADSDRVINFYNLMPLYNEETQVKLDRGLDYLLDQFDDEELFGVIDIQRRNVGKKKKSIKPDIEAKKVTCVECEEKTPINAGSDENPLCPGCYDRMAKAYGTFPSSGGTGSSDNSGHTAPPKKGMQMGVLSGLIMILIAAVWFIAGLSADRMYFYPPVLLVIGIYTLFKGRATGNMRGKRH